MLPVIKPIASTNNIYGADENGDIWRIGGPKTPRPRKLKSQVNQNGYLSVSISIGNVVRNRSVHRLVAEAFLGEPQDISLDVCHLNHVRTDNSPANLAYGSRSKNCSQSAKDGRYGYWRVGIKPASTKLSETQNLEIINRYAAGAYQADIAAEYGVTQGLVSKIIRTRFPNA